VRFIFELALRAWQSLVSSMGTTTLATFVGFVIVPIVILLAKLASGGREGLREHWRVNALVVSITGLVWIGLFAWHLFFSVPEHIRADAKSARPPFVVGNHVVPPFATDKTTRRPQPVTISPQRVIYGSVAAASVDALSDRYTFRIRNITDRDMFDIAFKLVVDLPRAPHEDFRFDIPKSSQKPIDENDPVVGSKFADILGTDCTDSAGRLVLYRFIPHLSPGETREVTLTHMNPGVDSVTSGLPAKLTIPSKAGIVVSAAVTHFSTKADPILVRGNLRAVPVYLAETLKCSHASFAILK
jgi:hypothetical protein